MLYSGQLLDRLGPAIKSKALSAADRVGVLSDGASPAISTQGNRPRSESLTPCRICALVASSLPSRHASKRHASI